MDRTTVVCGKVAFDAENDDWVMYIDDRFVEMSDLFAAVNRQLRRLGLPDLRVGDELVVSVVRAGEEGGHVSGPAIARAPHGRGETGRRAYGET